MAAGRVELQPDAIDLSAFILDVVSEVESLMSEKNLAASIAVSSSIPRIHTDPNHLRQILVNLIGNAVKYTEHGSVTVRARLATDGELSHLPSAVAVLGTKQAGAAWVAIQVIDTGYGIATADQARIFEEFEQVNPGSRGDSSERGTGLGLAISRRLSHLLGGEITVRSELNKGSTFTLWLPSDGSLGLSSQNPLNA
jgi:signal transduction histidine kinase